MTFDRPIIIVESKGIACWIDIEVKDQLLTDDTFRIKGDEESVCQLAYHCIFHGFINKVRNIILFLINFEFVFGRFLDSFGVVIIADDRLMHLVCFRGL